MTTKNQHKAMPFALAQAIKLRTAICLLEEGFADDIDLDDLSISASTLESLHARVAELEAQLEAIGAGGVGSQRITKKGEPDGA